MPDSSKTTSLERKGKESQSPQVDTAEVPTEEIPTGIDEALVEEFTWGTALNQGVSVELSHPIELGDGSPAIEVIDGSERKWAIKLADSFAGAFGLRKLYKHINEDGFPLSATATYTDSRTATLEFPDRDSIPGVACIRPAEYDSTETQSVVDLPFNSDVLAATSNEPFIVTGLARVDENKVQVGVKKDHCVTSFDLDFDAVGSYGSHDISTLTQTAACGDIGELVGEPVAVMPRFNGKRTRQGGVVSNNGRWVLLTAVRPDETDVWKPSEYTTAASETTNKSASNTDTAQNTWPIAVNQYVPWM